MRLQAILVSFPSIIAVVRGISVTEIQGTSYQSPYAGKFVEDVAGVVTAKDKYGFWISGEPSDDPRASNGLRVYTTSAGRFVNVGENISLSGTVSEYRANGRPNDLFLTELVSPTAIQSVSEGNLVEPVVLGRNNRVATGPLSRWDEGLDGWLSVPNNVTLLESANSQLRPDLYGLDFWESFEGQLVTLPSPVAANFPDRFGSFWAYGAYPVTGKNSRGGLTITMLPGGVPAAHPEAIMIGRPLDASRNPSTMIGMQLSDITGILTYQYGYYYILPLTAPKVLSTPDPVRPPPAILDDSADPCTLTIGDYNVENLNPRSHHLPLIAQHIVDYLKTPSIVFLQEISDDSGPRNDGTTSADQTLSNLVKAIQKASGVEYEYVCIDPLDNEDGGKPGGNIRVAYLWRPNLVSLVPGEKGNATAATAPILDGKGVALSLNPGRIDPMNDAWEESRKPLAAAWQTSTGERFYTVNVHFSSKRDSSSPHGDARPPVNGVVERRNKQVAVTADFAESIIALDRNASIIIGGDMNEYLQTSYVFAPYKGLLIDANVAAGVPEEERYTYVYDQHCQEIDHLFLSHPIVDRGVTVEHLHVNTWAKSVGSRASDHDPSLLRIGVCDATRERSAPAESVFDYLAQRMQVMFEHIFLALWLIPIALIFVYMRRRRSDYTLIA